MVGTRTLVDARVVRIACALMSLYSGSVVNGFRVAQVQMWSLSVGCRDLTSPCIINPVSAKSPMTNITRNHQPAITTCLVPSIRLDNSYALLRGKKLSCVSFSSILMPRHPRPLLDPLI